jgi:hypothetical protein
MLQLRRVPHDTMQEFILADFKQVDQCTSEEVEEVFSAKGFENDDAKVFANFLCDEIDEKIDFDHLGNRLKSLIEPYNVYDENEEIKLMMDLSTLLRGP